MTRTEFYGPEWFTETIAKDIQSQERRGWSVKEIVNFAGPGIDQLRRGVIVIYEKEG